MIWVNGTELGNLAVQNVASYELLVGSIFPFIFGPCACTMNHDATWTEIVSS